MATAPDRSLSVMNAARPDSSPSPRRWFALLVMLAGTFVVVLDFFIVNVAIPSLGRSLQASSGAIEWVVAGYGLAYAAGLITGGRLGDLYGQRRLFTLGLALFTLASLGCGLAPSAETLVLARVAQGVAAALLTPSALSLVGVVFTGADRIRAFTAYGLTLGLASVCGQLIGGVLIRVDVAGLGWRSIFLINIPICAVAVLLTPRLIPEYRTDRGGTLDLGGAALVTLGFIALVLPLIQGREQGWPLWSRLCLVAAPLLLLAFGLYQRHRGARGRVQLIKLELFRERAFTIGLLAVLALFAGMASFFLVLALYLQQGRGIDPLASGEIFTVMAVGFFVTSMCAPQLTRKLGRQSLAVGAMSLAGGQALLAVTAGHIGLTGNVALLLPALLIDGAGMGLVIAPLTSAILAGISPNHAGGAAGVLTAMQQVGAALGIAIIGIIFYGSLGQPARLDSYTHAFTASLEYLAILAVTVALLIQLLPPDRT